MWRNPSGLQLLELIFWSLLEWFYWMAFLVLLVWFVAQVQVESSLREREDLVNNLNEYAEIGNNWQPLIAIAGIAEPALPVVSLLKQSGLLSMLKTSVGKINWTLMGSLVAIESSESALNAVVYVGKELHSINELSQTAQDTERFLQEPSISNLRVMMVSCQTGRDTLLLAQKDLHELVDKVGPFVDATEGAMHISADWIRSLPSPGLDASLFERAANFVETLTTPAADLVSEAEGYSNRIAADARVLASVHQSLAVAEMRENLFTFYIFRQPVQLFLDHIWWINAFVIPLIAVRMLFGYRKRIAARLGGATPQTPYTTEPAF